MPQTETEIAALLQHIVRKMNGGLRYPIMSGTVQAGTVDETTQQCTVLLSVDDPESTGTAGVLLNAVSLNANGWILYPADNSPVWVCEIDGPGKWGIVRCADLEKATLVVGSSSLTVTDGLMQFNGGSHNGVVNGPDLKTRLNHLENDLNILKTAVAGWTPVASDGGAALKTASASWASATLTLTAETDIEDNTLKH